MKVFEQFYMKIEDEQNREQFKEMLEWVHDAFPSLDPAYKWNQPMFTENGTFIVSFNIAKKHFSVAPEFKGIETFKARAESLGYQTSKMFIKIGWDQKVDYEFLTDIIEFNREDKRGSLTFWRKG